MVIFVQRQQALPGSGHKEHYAERGSEALYASESIHKKGFQVAEPEEM